MIPPNVIDLKIAELLGGYCLCPSPQIYRDAFPETELIGTCKDCRLKERLVWSASHDAVRKLEIKDWGNFILTLGKIVGESFGGWVEVTKEQAIKLLRATAEQGCLAWIQSEHHYRWVECEECRGEQTVDGGHHLCPICSGRGGEWEKMKGDRRG